MKQDLTALCCECGMVRKVSDHQSVGEAQSAYGLARCVVWRKCRACGYRTYHAYLRDDEDCDELEDALRLGGQGAEALDEEVEQLRLCGVEVGHASVPAIWDGQSVGMVIHRLTDHAYSIVLAPEASVVSRIKIIDLMWYELLVGEHDDRWQIQEPEDNSPGYAVRLFGYRTRG